VGQETKKRLVFASHDSQRITGTRGECTNLRFTAVEDLKPFNLELLSYFESPPLQEDLGNLDVITVLRQALPFWEAETL